jgi:hypothetical protein
MLPVDARPHKAPVQYPQRCCRPRSSVAAAARQSVWLPAHTVVRLGIVRAVQPRACQALASQRLGRPACSSGGRAATPARTSRSPQRTAGWFSPGAAAALSLVPVLAHAGAASEAQGRPPDSRPPAPGLAQPDAAGAAPHQAPHRQPRVGAPRARAPPGHAGGDVASGAPA